MQFLFQTFSAVDVVVLLLLLCVFLLLFFIIFFFFAYLTSIDLSLFFLLSAIFPCVFFADKNQQW